MNECRDVRIRRTGRQNRNRLGTNDRTKRDERVAIIDLAPVEAAAIRHDANVLELAELRKVIAQNVTLTVDRQVRDVEFAHTVARTAARRGRDRCCVACTRRLDDGVQFGAVGLSAAITNSKIKYNK